MDHTLSDGERRHYLRRLNRLEDERKRGWEGHWRELAQHFLPRRSRFLDGGEPTNRGEARNRLEDSIGIMALRTLASGMQSGLTSPGRPWFSLGFENPALRDDPAARLWLDDTHDKMLGLLGRSNFYDQAHVLYSELACFGTAAVIVEEDSTSILRFRTLTVGEYALDAGADGRVDTIYRRIRMTPRQIWQAWPHSCPDRVADMARRDESPWLTLLHAVEPNTARASVGLGGRSRPWRSVYMFLDGPGEVLEDSGYYEFPALCPRWSVTGSDVYGTSPAMDALGDCRQLQRMTADGRLALELEVRPPWLVQTGAVNGGLDISPGALNYSTALLQQGREMVRPLMESRANLQALSVEKENLRAQIRRHFHNDLFQLFGDVQRQMTATEVAERNAEKMLMLGPVLDRLRDELFQPLIARVFAIMDRAGLIAFPPPVLRGQRVRVEFSSILAQAQRAAGLAAVDQLVGRVGQLAATLGSPDALDRLNTDTIVELYAQMLGTPPNLLRDVHSVLPLRQMRARALQEAQGLEGMERMAHLAEAGGRAAQALQACAPTAAADGPKPDGPAADGPDA